MSGDDQIRRVRQLSDGLLAVMAGVSRDEAVIALLDAGVRILRSIDPTLTTADACRELARVAGKIARAEGSVA